MMVTPSPFRQLAAAAAVLLALAGNGAFANESIRHLHDAVKALESGLTNEALASVSESAKADANEPLACVVAGLALMCGKRPDDAAKAFRAALELDRNSAEAEYGLGVLALSTGALAEAGERFARAQSLDPGIGAAGAIEYVKALAGGGYVRVQTDTPDECLTALNAAALMRDRRFDEAAALWKELQGRAVRRGFGERVGCSLTFLHSRPVTLTGWPVRSYRPAVPDRKKLNKVSGKVVLRADLSKTPRVDVVSFFINNRLAAMTNHPPFQYTWDTLKAGNGVHTVTIRAMHDGHTVSEKTVQVLVQNPGGDRVYADSTERADLRSRLRDVLRLKPSAAAVNYNLAMCALETGDDETAAGALERVMAADPEYHDAAERLAAIYRRQGMTYSRVERLSTSGRKAALTFDDGPRKGTERLLELLREKGVRATFFVVGKQAEAHPELLRMIAEDGHEIQNHTYGHRALDLVPENEIVQEIFRTCAVVRSITGRSLRMLRPPGGREGGRLQEVLRRFGMSSVFWTVNCVGAEGTTREQLVSRALSSTEPGAIILMHNYESVTLQALPEIIDRLRNAGYEFVTLSEASGGAKT